MFDSHKKGSGLRSGQGPPGVPGAPGLEKRLSGIDGRTHRLLGSGLGLGALGMARWHGTESRF